MAVSKAKKSEILNELVQKIKDAKSIGFTQTNAMSVEGFQELKISLREVNATYFVTKKTLMRIAVKEALDLDINLEDLPGQVWMIFSNEDPISGLSRANDYVKKVYKKKAEVQKIDWLLSIYDGQVQDIEATKVIASMPSRDTLLWRLVGSMKTPISSLARFFDARAKEIETQWVSKVSELQKKEEEKD